MLVFKGLINCLLLIMQVVANENSYKKYFLPRLKTKNYSIEIDARNFYDESINDLIKQYDETRKNINRTR